MIILLKKEWLEMLRSYRIVWLPLLFILLGISDPLTNYYMEDILATVGNMPDGFSMTMPELAPSDLLIASLGQFQMIGLLVIVAITASMISRERQNGTATLIYVRPVSNFSIYMSKLIAMALLTLVCTIAGFGASMYYTYLLYGGVSTTAFLLLMLFYWLWLLMVIATTITFSALWTTSIAMTVAIVLFPLGILLDSVIGAYWHYSPYKLALYGASWLTTQSDYLWGTCSIVVAWTIFVSLLGIWATGWKRSTTKI
ncbi:ABC transporter permease [Kurthia sp. 3B1D]|uniref:ABC transporter permease n=2 Tax=Kurthia TaxID=1649 RepID=A0A433RQF1_9BACL|nr:MULTISPECIES: ABC transporter permease subunit [unclassified Kurthia]RUS53009.1 ABC transporter permease [Kurthia sp. 3B1D]HIX43347.1 ABC transporter permease [Candidatus Kurthia intestinigallinarum]